MPDEIDQAQAAEELFLRQSMQKISESQDALKPKGSCYYCHTDFPENDERRFCDVDCRDDYVKEQKLLRIKGAR